MDDPRDAVMIETAASVLVGLVRAHRLGDHTAVAEELGRLLRAVAAYTASECDRRDAALLRALRL